MTGLAYSVRLARARMQYRNHGEFLRHVREGHDAIFSKDTDELGSLRAKKVWISEAFLIISYGSEELRDGTTPHLDQNQQRPLLVQGSPSGTAGFYLNTAISYGILKSSSTSQDEQSHMEVKILATHRFRLSL